MNLYLMFRACQRIMFIFDMFLWDRTGENYIDEGGSIDKDSSDNGAGIVE